MHGCDRLVVHLCILFNLFLKYGVLPKQFMQCVVIPLVKNTSGDLTDINNYRAISISSAISKLFESTLYEFISCKLQCDDSQFGFKSGHSTGVCTNVLKQTVDYYTKRGSYVFATFVDFNKAFDKVSYWKLFHMLLDDGVDKYIVQLLASWYSTQEMCVRWHNSVSGFFTLGNGTRQGGVLSPLLFARYIRQILVDVSNAGVGCNIGRLFINILAYADDIVLIAPAWKAMQLLIDVLLANACLIDMTCNVLKTVCMVYPPKNCSKRFASVFPSFKCGDMPLQYVQQFKYLGHILDSGLCDNDDIQREIRNMFVRVNILTRKFFRCYALVKVQLFKIYCICLYDAALWKCYTASKINKLPSCYNRCIKAFFKFKRRDSMSQILVDLQLPSFDTVMYNSSVTFSRQWHSCCNSIVMHLSAIMT